MITASAETHGNHLHVVFKFPDRKNLVVDIPGTDPGKLMGEAERLLYFEIRKYILIKMRGWLKQRMYTFNITNRAKYGQDAARLLMVLGYYENRSCVKICELICNNRPAIEALAPSDKSAHYSFYSKIIVPVLDYCQSMKGASA